MEPKPRYNQGKPSLDNISEQLTHVKRCCVVVWSNILGFQKGKICRYRQRRQSTNLAKAVLRQCHDPRYLAASPKPSPCTLLFITSWGRKRILPGGVFIVHGGHIGRGLIYSDFGIWEKKWCLYDNFLHLTFCILSFCDLNAHVQENCSNLRVCGDPGKYSSKTSS